MSVTWLSGVALERAILVRFRLSDRAIGVVAGSPAIGGPIACDEGGLTGSRCYSRRGFRCDLGQICDPLGGRRVDGGFVGDGERLRREPLGELSRARGLTPCLEEVSRSRPFVLHRS